MKAFFEKVWSWVLAHKIVSIVCAAVLVVGIVCAIVIPIAVGAGHQHTFSEEWTYDETGHWHAATCKHKSEIQGKEEHSMVAGEITAPTTEAEGYTTYTCSVCGYTERRDLRARLLTESEQKDALASKISGTSISKVVAANPIRVQEDRAKQVNSGVDQIADQIRGFFGAGKKLDLQIENLKKKTDPETEQIVPDPIVVGGYVLFFGENEICLSSAKKGDTELIHLFLDPETDDLYYYFDPNLPAAPEGEKKDEDQKQDEEEEDEEPPQPVSIYLCNLGDLIAKIKGFVSGESFPTELHAADLLALVPVPLGDSEEDRKNIEELIDFILSYELPEMSAEDFNYKNGYAWVSLEYINGVVDDVFAKMPESIRKTIEDAAQVKMMIKSMIASFHLKIGFRADAEGISGIAFSIAPDADLMASMSLPVSELTLDFAYDGFRVFNAASFDLGVKIPLPQPKDDEGNKDEEEQEQQGQQGQQGEEEEQAAPEPRFYEISLAFSADRSQGSLNAEVLIPGDMDTRAAVTGGWKTGEEFRLNAVYEIVLPESEEEIPEIPPILSLDLTASRDRAQITAEIAMGEGTRSFRGEWKRGESITARYENTAKGVAEDYGRESPDPEKPDSVVAEITVGLGKEKCDLTATFAVNGEVLHKITAKYENKDGVRSLEAAYEQADDQIGVSFRGSLAKDAVVSFDLAIEQKGEEEYCDIDSDPEQSLYSDNKIEFHAENIRLHDLIRKGANVEARILGNRTIVGWKVIDEDGKPVDEANYSKGIKENIEELKDAKIELIAKKAVEEDGATETLRLTILDSFASIHGEERVWKFDGGREVFVSYGPAGEFENQLTPDVRAAFTHEEDDPGYLFTGIPQMLAIMLIGS